MSVPRDRAKRLFTHYMEVVGRHAGITWDGDNYTEWDELIDDIIDAAVEAVREEIKQEVERRR